MEESLKKILLVEDDPNFGTDQSYLSLRDDFFLQLV